MSTNLWIATSVIVLACGVLFWLSTRWVGLLLGAVISATALLQGLAADRMPDLGILIAAAALQGKPLPVKAQWLQYMPSVVYLPFLAYGALNGYESFSTLAVKVAFLWTAWLWARFYHARWTLARSR